MDRNIAVVGVGYWGKNLVRNFAELGVLHTICDANPEVLQIIGNLYPEVNKDMSFTSLLSNNEIKGIVISTRAALHHSMAKEALLAGKDVFVEKPLALRVEEGEELVRLAEEKNKILMVGHLLEYHPGVIKLKELVDNGELGKIQYIYSNRLNLGRFRTEENILWSFAPHDISIILLLLGEMPEHVSAHGGGYLREDVADVTVTTMYFSSGVRSHIFVNWLHPYKEQRLVVVGDRQMAVFDDVLKEDKVKLYSHNIQWIDRIAVPDQQEAKPVEFTMIEPLRVECQHFIDCISSRQRPKTDGISALRILRILDACQRSLQSGHAVITLSSEEGVFIHPTSLVENHGDIGRGTKIWHFCHIMPRVNIGENCTIGQNVFLGENVNIGNNVKIENNVSVFEGVTLEDDVFCGPASVFTNVKTPRSHISRRGKYDSTFVGKGATIGANATIICGNTIGNYALIGAGSVVTMDVPDYALVYGNPARIRGWVCRCGTAIDFDGGRSAQCPECGKIYKRQGRKKVICSEGE